MAAPLRKDDTFTQDNKGYPKAANEDFYSSNVQRIKTGDRSAQVQKINQARNVRTEMKTSTMPGAPKNKQFDSSRPDIATEFNQSYAKKGIQPLSLDDRPVREPYQPVRPINRAQVEYSPQPREALPQRNTKLKLKGGNVSTAQNGLARARVTVLNIWIWSAVAVTYVFQLIFAIVSLVFLGLAGAISAFKDSLKPTEDDGLILSGILHGISYFTEAAGWAVGKISKAFGFDISILDPMNFFLIGHLIVFCYGVIILLLIYLIYKIAMINPLSGKGAGLKMGLFLLALVGYSIPLFNLIPWFIPWTIAVRFYPK